MENYIFCGAETMLHVGSRAVCVACDIERPKQPITEKPGKAKE